MRNIWKKFITGLSVALGLAAGGATAQAGFNVQQYNNAGVPTTGTPGVMMGLGAFGINSPTFEGAVNAGAFQWQATSLGVGAPTEPFLVGEVFRAFCLELVPYTGTTYHFDYQALETLPTSGAMGSTKADDVRIFFQRYAGTISNLLKPTTDATDAANKLLAAAIQLAIWEIVYENGTAYDVTTGTGFSVDTPAGPVLLDAVNKANDLLAHTNFAATPSITNVLSYKVTNADSEQQDQITIRDGDDDEGVDVVPAPPALILALVGIVPCLALRRRLRGQTA